VRRARSARPPPDRRISRYLCSSGTPHRAGCRCRGRFRKAGSRPAGWVRAHRAAPLHRLAVDGQHEVARRPAPPAPPWPPLELHRGVDQLVRGGCRQLCATAVKRGRSASPPGPCPDRPRGSKFSVCESMSSFQCGPKLARQLEIRPCRARAFSCSMARARPPSRGSTTPRVALGELPRPRGLTPVQRHRQGPVRAGATGPLGVERAGQVAVHVLPGWFDAAQHRHQAPRPGRSGSWMESSGGGPGAPPWECRPCSGRARCGPR